MSFYKVLLFVFLLLIPSKGFAEIKGPRISQNSQWLVVSFQYSPNDKLIKIIKKRGRTDITIHIDLFRKWSPLPNEFITGRKFFIKIFVDPMKEEYVAILFDKDRIEQKRYRSLDSMIKNIFRFRGVRLEKIKGILNGIYFVRITVETEKENIPSLIGKIFFFLPTKEIKEVQDSHIFEIRNEELRFFKPQLRK